jgi:hypothetical protein
MSTARTRPAAATFPTRLARLPETGCTPTPDLEVTDVDDEGLQSKTQFS